MTVLYSDEGTGRGDRGSTVFELAVVLQYRYFVGSLIPFPRCMRRPLLPFLVPNTFLGEIRGRGGFSFECSEVYKEFYFFFFFLS